MHTDPLFSGGVELFDPGLVERFLFRVAELTSRYHESGSGWTCGSEVIKWNEKNSQVGPDLDTIRCRTRWGRIFQPCLQCVPPPEEHRLVRECIIDPKNTTCATCQTRHVRCLRTKSFVYDLTKDEFFSDFSQFSKVYDTKSRNMRRYKQRATSLRKHKARSNESSSAGELTLMRVRTRHWTHFLSQSDILAVNNQCIDDATLNGTWLLAIYLVFLWGCWLFQFVHDRWDVSCNGVSGNILIHYWLWIHTVLIVRTRETLVEKLSFIKNRIESLIQELNVEFSNEPFLKVLVLALEEVRVSVANTLARIDLVSVFGSSFCPSLKHSDRWHDV